MKKDFPEINIDELMERIRAEIEKRKSLSGEKTEASANSVQQKDSSLSTPLHVEDASAATHVTTPELNKEYTIHELCQYHDIDFITNAYQVILHRDPATDEINIWLSKLRTGDLTKKEILALLRFGSEGREKKVPVKGLLIRFLFHGLFKIPVLGRLFRTMGYVAHLPHLFRNIQGMEYSLNSRFDQLSSKFIEGDKVHSALSQKVDWVHVSSLNKSVQQLERRLDETDLNLQVTSSRLEQINAYVQATNSHLEVNKLYIKEIDSRLEKKESRLQEIDTRLQLTNSPLTALLRETDSRMAELKCNFQGIHEKMNVELVDIERQVRDARFNVLAQQRRLDELLQQGQRQWGDATKQGETQETANDHILDALYVAFEDRFRGTREEIKNRQSVYLPYVVKALSETGGGVILDVGCGRGEWLELLVEKGYTAKGVDLNQMMVVQSREFGLDVEEANVFNYFTDIASDSLSVVTGLHIVEHLPFQTMISLFDQVYRVLKPGGMIIFETPNPENILVGSCDFYYDPTHKNPIPPATLSFLLEARGYQNLEVLRLHENAAYADLKETDISVKITSRFFGPQDYSVIGYKV